MFIPHLPLVWLCSRNFHPGLWEFSPQGVNSFREYCSLWRWCLFTLASNLIHWGNSTADISWQAASTFYISCFKRIQKPTLPPYMAETFSVLSLLDKPPVQIVEISPKKILVWWLLVDDSQVPKPNLHMFWSNPSILSSHSTGSGPSDRGRYKMLQACCFGHVLHSKQKPASATEISWWDELDLDCDRAGCNIAGFVVLHLRIYAFLAAPAETKTCVVFTRPWDPRTDSTAPAKGPSHHRLQRLVSECGRECHFHSWWSLFQWGHEQRGWILINEKGTDAWNHESFKFRQAAIRPWSPILCHGAYSGGKDSDVCSDAQLLMLSISYATVPSPPRSSPADMGWAHKRRHHPTSSEEGENILLKSHWRHFACDSYV